VSELLPCPFCGGSRLSFVGKQQPYWYVLCDECGVSDGLCHTKDQAHESWNTRPSPPAEVAKVEGSDTVTIPRKAFELWGVALANIALGLPDAAKVAQLALRDAAFTEQRAKAISEEGGT
jgi:Lar family restriction alleviation protein